MLDWIKKIKPDFKQEDWHNDVVIGSGLIENRYFYEKKEITEEYIDPRGIIGLDYSYAYNHDPFSENGYLKNYTWLKHLNNLKRQEYLINNFHSIEDISIHIHKRGRYDEPKFVDQYGDLIIIRGGQHRLCVAKFLKIQKVMVYVTHFELNEEKWRKYEDSKKALDFFKSIEIIDKEVNLNEDYLDVTSFVDLRLYGKRITITASLLLHFYNYYRQQQINVFNYLPSLCNAKYWKKQDDNPLCVNRDEFDKIKGLVRLDKYNQKKKTT